MLPLFILFSPSSLTILSSFFLTHNMLQWIPPLLIIPQDPMSFRSRLQKAPWLSQAAPLPQVPIRSVCLSTNRSYGTRHPIQFPGLLVASPRTQIVSAKKHSFRELVVSAVQLKFRTRDPHPMTTKRGHADRKHSVVQRAIHTVSFGFESQIFHYW